MASVIIRIYSSFVPSFVLPEFIFSKAVLITSLRIEIIFPLASSEVSNFFIAAISLLTVWNDTPYSLAISASVTPIDHNRNSRPRRISSSASLLLIRPPFFILFTSLYLLFFINPFSINIPNSSIPSYLSTFPDIFIPSFGLAFRL